MNWSEVTQEDGRAGCNRFFLRDLQQVLQSIVLLITQSWSAAQGIPPPHFQGHLANKVGGLKSQTAIYTYFKPFCSTAARGVKLDVDLPHYYQKHFKLLQNITFKYE